MPNNVEGRAHKRRPDYVSRRGAISTALLFGLGSGMLLGVGLDISLLVFQAGSPIPDLVGKLGLPGAIVALALAFWLGARAVVTIRQGNSNGGDALAAERRTNSAVDKILERLDDLRDDLRTGLKENRHDVRNALTITHGETMDALRRLGGVP